MTFRTYRKRPVHVEAVRWWGPFVGDGKQGPTWRDLREFGCDAEPTSYWGLDCGEPGCKLNADIELPTLEGRMLCRPGDWIIKGVAGEFYSCKNEIFEETYETADGMPEDVGEGSCCDV